MRAGALSLSSPELKIHLASAESTEPVDVEQKQAFETNSLVEEFMLLANISVAAKIQEAYPATAVLRRHSPPPKTNFEALQDILSKRKNMELDVSSSGALADSLDHCVVCHMLSAHGQPLTSRTLLYLNSTRWFESWQRGVCWLPSTSARARCRRSHTDTTVLQLPSTRISL